MIKKAAVIGAGTMGAGIAAHLANAGVQVLLMDIVPEGTAGKERNRLASSARERLLKGRPAGFMNPADAALVDVGNIEDDLERVRDCDWIVEAVTENLEIKRALYGKLAGLRSPQAIVSSNTSGLALNLLTDGLDQGFREHFLITHFFNPPRYMYLLEIVVGPETLPAVTAEVENFCDLRLGKGLVRCKDTPNFIANRIGVYSMAMCCRLLVEEGLTVEEADTVTGPPMGRPKTASFRLHDLVGLDIAVAVMENSRKLLKSDESLANFEPPELLLRLVKAGRLGRKTGEGFYKKVGKEILVLDLETFEYRPQAKVEFASLAAAKKEKTVEARLKALVEGDDKAARYAWRTLSETLAYAARRVPEIADEIVSVDRAIRWGFNWEIGPFEAWDAIGVANGAERLRSEGREVPALVEAVLKSGRDSFYGEASGRRTYFDLASGDALPEPERPGIVDLGSLRRGGTPLRTSSEASLWDLGDGVLCVEFHSKMNSLSGDMLTIVSESVTLVEEGDYVGLVVGNQAPNFSVGANIAKLVEAAKAENWDAIDAMIRQFHATVLRMRYASKPVVVAIQGMALGGGCEMALAGCRVQAAAESYVGLVELGVGLIPAGGGCREMACRASEAAGEGAASDIYPFVSAAFQNIGQAKISTSAAEARQLLYLRDVDAISMNKDRTVADAKATVRHLSQLGYQPPRPRQRVRVLGRPGIGEMEVFLHQYHVAGYLSEYDLIVAKKLAHVLCGGDIDAEHTVDEQYLLDLEREAFLSLTGETKTRERIEHMLKTGKPLRN